jgi:two-component system OmpR family sensor kinase
VSLRFWLAAGYTALLAVMLAAFGVLLLLGMQRALQNEMDKRLQVRADQLQAQLEPSSGGQTLPTGTIDLSRITNLDDPVVYAQVRDLDGRLLASSTNLGNNALPLSGDAIQHIAAGQDSSIRDVSIGNLPVRSLATALKVQGAPAAILQVAESRRPLDRTLSDLRLLLALLGIAACGGAGLLGWGITRRGLRPLNAVARQASDIARSREFDQRVEAGAPVTEVDLLAGTINELLTTIDGVLRRHREFLADTSHELRNPLLAVRGNLELLDMVDDPAAREECIREARQQVERMTRLVNDLLSLAQIESGLLLEPKPMDLSETALRTVRSFQRREMERSFVVEQPGPVPLTADEGRIEQVLVNLLDNAVRHTSPGGHITVRVATENGRALVSVADDGEGIAPEHLPHLFDRFYRVGPAGHSLRLGFGLPIVKRVVEGHGGTVTVESQPGRGTCFRVSLPLNGPAGS